MNLQTAKTKLTALKIFGISRNVVLRKYNEIDRKSFRQFLKEYEFRFNFTHRPNGLKSCGDGIEFRVNLTHSLLLSISY